MFKRLKLINFRQHENREWFFTPGLNAIRGVNESGKTTMLEGAAYVMFGAKIALREPIDAVVSYGAKVSSMKAEVDMEIGGTVYTGKRSKAGAEVWLAGGLKPLVVGQDECTKFWESLLGVSAKVASNLMLANQVSIRGALSQGASAPMLLIEKLANLGLIDQIITLVNEEVPVGQTKAVVERIVELETRWKESEGSVEDLMPLRVNAQQAEDDVISASVIRDLSQSACDAHRPAADAAQRAKNDAVQVTIQYNESANAVRLAQTVVDKAVVPPAPDMSGVPELRKSIADAQRFSRALASHKALTALPAPEAEWDEGMDKLLASIKEQESKVIKVRARRDEAKIAASRKEAAIIKETTCAFCQKDLTDVPEVTTHNSKLHTELEALRGDIADADDALDALEGDIADLQAVVKASNARDRSYRQHVEFISLDEKYAPARWLWTGPDVTKVVADPSDTLAQLENAERAHHQAAGAKAQAEVALKDATDRRDALKVKQDAAEVAAAAGEPDLTKAVELAEALAAAEAALRSAREAAQNAASALNTAEAVQRERIAARERLKTDLDTERSNLKEIVQGNALLAKLRAARPQIADKLWKMVLTSVSTYFTSGRGKASVVTRADNGFLVDGQSIDGLSGSTLDILGLAIRVALVKTFLPNCGFMVLDEPAAACDDGRETNLLALIATVGFEQVLLVTHRDLSDAFAQQVIQL